MLGKRWAKYGAMLLAATFALGRLAGEATTLPVKIPTTAATTTATTNATTVPATLPAAVPATAPAPSALQLALDANDMEWKVIGPLVKQLVWARKVLETAGSKDRVVDPFGFFGNDAFAGPSASARGGLGISEGFTGWGVGTTKPTTQASTQGMLMPVDEGRDVARGTGGRGGETLAMALVNLQTAAADPKMTDVMLRNELAVFRMARGRAQAAVDRANEALRKVLTDRQEGLMVAMGYLD